MQKRNKVLAGVLTGALVLSAGPMALAATANYNDSSVTGGSAAWQDWVKEWETVAADYTKVSLTPGADETQLNFAWYSKTESGKAATPVVHFGTDKDHLTAFTGKAAQVDDSLTDGVAYDYNHVTVTGLEAKGLGGAMKKLMGGGKNAAESLKEKLEAKGFEVTLYESPMDKIQKRIAAGEKVDFNIYFAGKDTIADFVGAQDLIITLVDVAGGFQAVARPGFGMTKGGGEIPWYVFELPVIVIGCQQPTILADIPQARTYINTYDSAPATLDVLVDELMAGPEAFKGKDPIDSFCGMWDTHL